jgi:hypothetical protein
MGHGNARNAVPEIMKDPAKGVSLRPDFPRPDDTMPILFPALVRKTSPENADPVRKHQIEQAQRLWELFNTGRSKRERELGQILSEHNRANAVLVMTLNQGHTDLLLNWVASCDRHGIEVRSWTLIVALDTTTAAVFEALGFAVYCDETSYGAPPREAAQAFGDNTFVQMMFPKTAVVQDVLNLGYDVLFQDVDLIWKKDPGEVLFHPDRRGLDAQFMYDGPNSAYQPLHANSGFFFLRNTSASRTFWNLVCQHFDQIIRMRSHQCVVNIVLNNRYFRDLSLDILKEADFANGHLFSTNRSDRLPDDPYVVHCSWTRNIEHKLIKYRLAGLWYL